MPYVSLGRPIRLFYSLAADGDSAHAPPEHPRPEVAAHWRMHMILPRPACRCPADPSDRYDSSSGHVRWTTTPCMGRNEHQLASRSPSGADKLGIWSCRDDDERNRPGEFPSAGHPIPSCMRTLWIGSARRARGGCGRYLLGLAWVDRTNNS